MAYSQDLRERVMAAVKADKLSNREIARLFGVSESTVEKWTARQRDSGSCAALPHAGGVPRVLRDCARVIRAEVRKQPDVTLAELCDRLAKTEGVTASPSMMCREVQRLKLPRKKSRSGIASSRRAG